MARKRSYWLLKTEPGEWSWEDQLLSDGGISRWDGVRNRQAQKNLRSMNIGDLCFFYHSGRERRIVGVVKVAKTWYGTADDDREGAVDVQTVAEMPRPVDLREIKAGEYGMKDFALIRQPRLSVVSVPEKIWDRICEMGGGFVGEDAGGKVKVKRKPGSECHHPSSCRPPNSECREDGLVSCKELGCTDWDQLC